jgi:MmeI, target recognition domain
LVVSNLTIGVDLDRAKPLLANDGLCSPGVKLHGAGFMVSPERAKQLGLGLIPGLEERIRPYRHGKDLTSRPRGLMVIDLDGLKEAEIREQYPEVYQHLFTHVYPERKHNNERYRRENWWLFGRRNTMLRAALQGLRRYVSTVETTKHRVFQFLEKTIMPDNMLVNIALDDAFFLGVLTSRIHVTWALAAGARLGVGNDPRYSKSRCFDPFPFPAATEAQREAIRDFAEQLDAHRKRVLAEHEDLTLTGLYNVLEKLRAGAALTEKERDIHERGLVSVMKQLHEQIDAAIFDAYGWPQDLSDEEILARLVELNKGRRAEEAKGLVRWLRPDYQAPAAKKIVVSEQGKLDITEVRSAAKAGAQKARWPKTLPERVTSIRGLLATQPRPAHLEELARRFQRAPRDDVQEVLNALVALGLARRLEDNRYAP